MAQGQLEKSGSSLNIIKVPLPTAYLIRQEKLQGHNIFLAFKGQASKGGSKKLKLEGKTYLCCNTTDFRGLTLRISLA